MCNHYRKANDVVEWSQTRIPGLTISVAFREIPEHTYPKYPAPVICEEAGVRTLIPVRWGIERFIAPGKIKAVTNARNDKLQGRTWKTCTDTRRCLIPATGYFEPGLGPVGAKGEILFTVKDRPRFFFAGLWDRNAEGLGFTMVTTEPNEYVRLYHDRMPVVLTDEEALCWLGDKPLPTSEIIHLCRGLPAEALRHDTLPAKLKISRPGKPTVTGEQGQLL
jgi:putative SOS response-associated peptidase YedK